MFNGRTALNLDAKGRLTVPTRYRESLNSACGG
ncbi:MAG TPA: division/cell wall cluster transcriptional repressor MraZ, partial [Alcanivorax sp.]|nr:division/cell wall cluster transcriptional repressor MraZ [Alcanivorax sp.]